MTHAADHSSPDHIAIIGCGFTGTSALLQLVGDRPVREITIFEQSGVFGPGYPYDTGDCTDYLINNTTDTMRVLPDTPSGFYTWLQARARLSPDKSTPDPGGHLPRAEFGHFLQAMVHAACDMATARGIVVRLVPHGVTDLHEDKGGRCHVTWGDDTGQANTIMADAALLTIGRCPDLGDTLPSSLADGAICIDTHIMDTRLDDLPLTGDIHVLGASLSAYDVVNRLFAPATGCEFRRAPDGVLYFHPGPNQRRVMLCSRSGRMKGVQGAVSPTITRQFFTIDAARRLAKGPGGLTLAAIANLIRAEADAHGATVDWQRLADPYVDCQTGGQVTAQAAELLQTALNDARHPDGHGFLTGLFADAANDIWQVFAEGLLPPAEEARYRRELETATLCFAAPCPVPTAERLLALLRAGQLHIITGVGDASINADGNYTIPHAHGTETATVLVNTTGQVNRNVTDPAQPDLIRNLVANGLLHPHERGNGPLPGAAVDMQTYRATGSQNLYIASMLLWGPGFFTSSARVMSQIVQQILQGLYNGR